MHFSNTAQDPRSKFTKIAIVTALHVALGIAIVGMKVKVAPSVEETDVVLIPTIEKEIELPPPPLPKEPPKQQPKVTQPRVTAPPPEVPVQQQQVEETVQPILASEAQPEAPADPGPATPQASPDPSPNTGKIYEAALADANSCAKPEYPAKAARNGESGTVALALLIGPDGRVSDSKVQKSSGSRELDRAAVAALSLCKFKPATNNGTPEAAWGRIAYVWSLES